MQIQASSAVRQQNLGYAHGVQSRQSTNVAVAAPSTRGSRKNMHETAQSRNGVFLCGEGRLSRGSSCGASVSARSGTFRVMSMSMENMSGSDAPPPKLADCELTPFISAKGRVMPDVMDRAAATVFAVFDENEAIQYIGFSKDIRNSLRTVLSRRPDQCHYFKTWDLGNLDQKRMLAARQAWIKEAGSPPGMGKDQVEFWQAPLKLGSRVKAKEMATEVFSKLEARGLTEEFNADPELQAGGVYDILTSGLKNDAEMDADDKRRADIKVNTFEVNMDIKGEHVSYTVYFASTQVTNGGWIYDVHVFYDDLETVHRVICGKEWPESTKVDSKEIVRTAFAFLLVNKVHRHTEGLLTSGMFPINYFSMSEVEQWFPSFATLFDKASPEAYWRFNKIEDYGWAAADNELSEGLPQLGPKKDEETSTA